MVHWSSKISSVEQLAQALCSASAMKPVYTLVSLWILGARERGDKCLRII